MYQKLITLGSQGVVTGVILINELLGDELLGHELLINELLGHE